MASTYAQLNFRDSKGTEFMFEFNCHHRGSSGHITPQYSVAIYQGGTVLAVGISSSDSYEAYVKFVGEIQRAWGRASTKRLKFFEDIYNEAVGMILSKHRGETKSYASMPA